MGDESATWALVVGIDRYSAPGIPLLEGAAADAARRLAAILWTEIEHAGLEKLAKEIELPLIPVLARMERSGIRRPVGRAQSLNSASNAARASVGAGRSRSLPNSWTVLGAKSAQALAAVFLAIRSGMVCRHSHRVPGGRYRRLRLFHRRRVHAAWANRIHGDLSSA